MTIRFGILLIVCLSALLQACGSGSSSEPDGLISPVQQPGVVDPVPNPAIGDSVITDNLGTGDVVGNDGFSLSNNSALLTGPAFGLNRDANVMLRKGVPFEIVGLAGDVVAERVVVVREEFDTSLPFVVAYIRNNTDSIRCGILFDDIEIVHDDGETFEVVNHFFSSGGVNESDEDSPRTVGNCLPARGTGYHVIAGSGQGQYDKVEKVRFSLADGFNISDGIRELPGTVVPVSYEVVDTSPNGVVTLSVSIQNNLFRSIFIAPPNVFALDEKGQPIMYSAAGLDNTAEAFTVGPGESKAVSILMYLSGISSTIRASVSFVYL